jgi:hypothetical protein
VVLEERNLTPADAPTKASGSRFLGPVNEGEVATVFPELERKYVLFACLITLGLWEWQKLVHGSDARHWADNTLVRRRVTLGTEYIFEDENYQSTKW